MQRQPKREKLQSDPQRATDLCRCTGILFTYHEVDKGVPYTGRQIVFEKDGITYTITSGLNDANRTQVQAAMLEKALNSFTFIK